MVLQNDKLIMVKLPKFLEGYVDHGINMYPITSSISENSNNSIPNGEVKFTIVEKEYTPEETRLINSFMKYWVDGMNDKGVK